MEKVILEIEKNDHDVIRVSLTEYQSHQMFSIRVYYEKAGDYLPSKREINLKIQFLPQVIAAL